MREYMRIALFPKETSTTSHHPQLPQIERDHGVAVGAQPTGTQPSGLGREYGGRPHDDDDRCATR